jgi:hypothetical protein
VKSTPRPFFNSFLTLSGPARPFQGNKTPYRINRAARGKTKKCSKPAPTLALVSQLALDVPKGVEMQGFRVELLVCLLTIGSQLMPQTKKRCL